MDLKAIAQTPKKVWLIGGGIGAGFLVIKFWRGRQGGTETEATQEATDLSPVPGSGQPTYAGGAYGGAVAPLIPPVIIGGDGGDSLTGVPALQDLYTGVVSSLIGNYENLFGPLYSTQQALLLNQSDTLNSIALAGSSPREAPQITVVTQEPIPQPAPVAIPTSYTPPAAAPSAPAYKIEYDNRTRDNGLSGAARRVWCNRVTIHRYPDGRGVVVSETKIKNGAC